MPNIKKIVVSGSAISQLTNDAGYALATNITGAFTAVSTSIAVDIAALELAVGSGGTLISSSAQIATDISGAFTATSASLSGRIDNINSSFTTFATTGSNTFVGNQTIIGNQTITGSLSLNHVSSSFAIQGNGFAQTQLSANGTIVLVAGNSGGVELAGLYKTFRATDVILGGFVSGEIRANNNVVSSSAQIATNISGAFTATSASFSTRVTTLEVNGPTNAATASYVSAANVKFAGDVQTLTDVSTSIAGRTTVLEGTGTIQGVGTTNNVTFANVTATGNVSITGTLFVDGTTTTVNSENLNIEDKFILLNSGSTGASYEGGIIVESGSTGTGNAFYYDASDNRWALKGGLSAGNTSAVTADAFMGMVLVSAIGSVDTSSAYYKAGTIIIDNQDFYIVTA